MSTEFVLFAAVGFLAQLIDGSLGMAYGIVASSVLLSVGVSPAAASASAHAAEMFTTATSAGAHIAHRNIDWKLFWTLMPAGMAGGAAGAYLLTSFEGEMVRPFVTAYLAVMGIYILYRAVFRMHEFHAHKPGFVAPLGAVGGGWGAVVTSGLLGAGGAPRTVIGTVNAAEFFLTVTISAAFLVAMLSGHWDSARGLQEHALAVAGLIVGGILATPFAGFVARHVPAKFLMLAVGGLVVLLAIYRTWELFQPTR